MTDRESSIIFYPPGKETPWTPQQLSAVEGRGGTLLVSAAAGSGKTAVLVERAVRRLADPEKKCSADSLIIVTFTRAAAAEMRQRIDRRLTDLISLNPSFDFLKKQKILLQSAKIGTTDSFCSDLVRENFYSLGLSPDFRMIDEAEESRFSKESVDAVLENEYAQNLDDFRILSEIIEFGGGDDKLSDAIVKFYKEIMSYPFPDDVLDRILKAYSDDLPPEQTPWGKAVMIELKGRVEYCQKLLSAVPSLRNIYSGDFNKYVSLVESLHNICALLIDFIEKENWDKLYDTLYSLPSFKLPTGKNEVYPVATKETVCEIIKTTREILMDAHELFPVTSKEFKEDSKALGSAVNAFVRCVRNYKETIAEMKRRENSFGFSDIAHFALDLLVEKSENGEYVKTPLAKDLSQRYTEIMVDEFQDTNELQELIYSSVSRNEENLFFVGDVKQSIYRFRQAMPEIFIRRRARLDEFDGENYPAKINLSANFRSRKQVTDAVNYMFSASMNEKFGDILYDDKEKLNPLGIFPEKPGCETELHIRDKSDSKTLAQNVAEYVDSLLKGDTLVSDHGALRPVRKKDICIITYRKSPMKEYVKALTDLGIAASCPVNASLGSTAEMKIVISLLKAIDNPLLDASLTAVMLSPIFGFTNDELAAIRSEKEKNEYVYQSVVKAAEKGDKHCADFLSVMGKMRQIEITMGMFDYLRSIYAYTDIEAIARVLPDPENRLTNLRTLLDVAGKFDETGKCGLSAFLKYAEKISFDDFGETFNNDIDTVKVMNAHKCKGLQYPICILSSFEPAVISHRPESIVVSRELGIGLKLRDRRTGKNVPTLQYFACSMLNNRMDKSEALRLLYVAMTRAEEKLVIFGSSSTGSIDEYLEKYNTFYPEDKVDSFLLSTKGSIFEWICHVFLKGCGSVSETEESPGCRQIGPNSSSIAGIKLFYHFSEKEIPEEAEEKAEEAKEDEIDENLLNAVRYRAGYKYPYSYLSVVSSKLQASVTNDEVFDEEHFASSKPYFAAPKGLSPAQKGTLTHLFMQNLLLNTDDFDRQVENIIEKKIMTREDISLLRTGEIKKFLQSDFYKRIISSDRVLRERQFTLLLPVSEAYDGIQSDSEDDSVLVQGMIDLIFFEGDRAVVVDYKTDRAVTEETLVQRHGEQMKVYKAAAEKCFGSVDTQVYIWSLYLNKAVKIDI